MFLIGKNVRLRPIHEDDLADLYRWRNSPEATGDYNNYQPADWFSYEKRIKSMGESPTEVAMFMIEKKDDRKKIGYAVHFVAHPLFRSVEIGYSVCEPDERGKGYATEAAGLLVDHLFSVRNIARIQATTSTKNAPSQRVLEKCGFKKEGVMRDNSFERGKLGDDYLYSIVRSDWMQAQGSAASRT